MQQPPEFVQRVDFGALNGRHRAAARLRGTDVLVGAGNDGMVPGSVHWELEGLVLAGFSPLEAITAATGTAAVMLGAEASIGTVEEGKLADLVLLDANPLDNIQNTRRIWRVIKGGRVVDREAIMLEASEAR